MNLEQWAPFYRARFFMLLNRHARALEGLEEALRVNPGFGRAASCLGYAHAMLGHDDLAIDRKSTRLNSSHIQKSRMPSSA